MFVERYKILVGTLPEGTGSTMTIPFGMDFFPIDNSELVQKEFVEKETQNAINPIIDYEKSKFIPYNQFISGNTNEIKIKLWNGSGSPLFYSDLGITDSDIKYRKNRFLNTFLRLSFYDSDQPTNSNFLFSTTYYTQLGDDQKDLTGCSPSTPNCLTPNANYGQPLTNTSMPVSYISSDPISLPNKIGEGFYIFWLNKDVKNGPKNIYCRATLNNAVDGTTTQYYAYLDITPPIYDVNLFQKLNIKYTIFKDNMGYYRYTIDNTNRSISINPSITTINLYKLKVQ